MTNRSVGVRVFLTAWLVYTAYFTPFIVREHFPAITLAEDGSFNVERFLGWSEDIFRGPRGGAYINNNPGASILGAVPLIVFRPVLRYSEGWVRSRPVALPSEAGDFMKRTVASHRELYFMVVALLTVMLVMAPTTAATAAFLSVRAMQAGAGAAWAAAAGLLFAFGTPVFFRTAYLNHNMLVASASLTAFLLLWDPARRPLSSRRALTAGLLAGFAVLCDYSGCVVLAAVGVYVWLRSSDGSQPARRRLAVAFIAGAAPPLIVLLAYQWQAFGVSVLPSQHFMTPTAPTTKGYRGFDWVSPALVWANFFDVRFGLFMYSPALALSACAGFLRNLKLCVPTREARMLAAYVAVFVLFCAANQYSWLQPSTGFRYLVPVVFALFIFTIQVLQVLPTGWRIAIGCGMVAQSWLQAATHERDASATLSRFVEMNGMPAWMHRGSALGLFAADWTWTLCLNLGIALSIVCIWAGFARRLLERRRAEAARA